ncbi:MAG: DUF4870 domain-containing protein [Chloroflexi bacterium]|nr:DUF4870 domain-containing protein [Chloroflexota bacterium]
MSENLQYTQDERVAAALAHGSVLLGLFTNGLGGFIGAALVWLTQKEKSEYVAFQSLQAIVYQSVMLVVSGIGLSCYLCAVFAPMILLVDEQLIESAPPAIFICPSICPLPVMFLVSGAFVLYGLYGAWRTLEGDDFRYAVIGRMIERKLKGSAE